MGLVDQARQIVGVTGFHCSGTNEIGAFLETRGYAIKFPDQDLDFWISDDPLICGRSVLCHGEKLYAECRENAEVLRYNQIALQTAGLNWHHTDERPLQVFPVTAPFIGMFPPQQNIVLSDPRLCFTLPAWEKHVTHWIWCDCPAKEAAGTMALRYGGSEAHWRRQADLYRKAGENILQRGLVVNYPEFRDDPQKHYKAFRKFGLRI